MAEIIEWPHKTKQKLEQTNFDDGYGYGAVWARDIVEAGQQRCIPDPIIARWLKADAASIGQLIEADWDDFWCGQGIMDPDETFVRGFMEGASRVFTHGVPAVFPDAAPKVLSHEIIAKALAIGTAVLEAETKRLHDAVLKALGGAPAADDTGPARR